MVTATHTSFNSKPNIIICRIVQGSVLPTDLSKNELKLNNNSQGKPPQLGSIERKSDKIIIRNWIMILLSPLKKIIKSKTTESRSRTSSITCIKRTLTEIEITLEESLKMPKIIRQMTKLPFNRHA